VAPVKPDESIAAAVGGAGGLRTHDGGWVGDCHSSSGEPAHTATEPGQRCMVPTLKVRQLNTAGSEALVQHPKPSNRSLNLCLTNMKRVGFFIRHSGSGRCNSSSVAGRYWCLPPTSLKNTTPDAGVPIAKVAKMSAGVPAKTVRMAARYGHFALEELHSAVDSISRTETRPEIQEGSPVFPPGYGCQ